MNTSRTGHLSEALDTAFNFLACDHHQVGHLVDDNNNIRNMIRWQRFCFVDWLAALIKSGLDLADKFVAIGTVLGGLVIEASEVTDARF